MPSDRARAALVDIRDNIALAIAFAGKIRRENFGEDKMVYYAVVRCLEIISEASRRLPDDLKARHPLIPWYQIANAGNVYRHGYDALASNRIWDTVDLALPALRAVVMAELEL